MDVELRNDLNQFLNTQKVLHLATKYQQALHSSPVFYINLEWNLYFISDPNSQHCQNMDTHPEVSFSIAAAATELSSIKGVQGKGKASLVLSFSEIKGVISLYLQKFPQAREKLTFWELYFSFFLNKLPFPKKSKLAFYKVVPSMLTLTDNSRGFGFKSNLELAPLN